MWPEQAKSSSLVQCCTDGQIIEKIKWFARFLQGSQYDGLNLDIVRNKSRKAAGLLTSRINVWNLAESNSICKKRLGNFSRKSQ